ncbi:DUF6489 family protein [Bacterioplanoides pacificum]|uniref:DUF6489 family protein n=1 Tax=Bacterioplanoides pacificum TaxID=1171596 RepID=A0ABV7VVW2_9GAMM
MKINVTFDMTPDEFRQVLGLPDVKTLQQEIFNQMVEKMQAGEEGYDPLSLYQPMMKEGMNAMGQFQEMMFSMMSGTKSDKSDS